MQLTITTKFECSKKPLYYGTYPTSFRTTAFLVGTEDTIVALHFMKQPIENHLAIIQKKIGQYPIPNSSIMQQHWEKMIRQEPSTLALCGTPFQQKVWQGLTTIPKGTTISYQTFAQQLQLPKSTRAVASAIAQNNIAYLIPCHRVVRCDGSLGGYRWGLAIKQKLLSMEKEKLSKQILGKITL